MARQAAFSPTLIFGADKMTDIVKYDANDIWPMSDSGIKVLNSRVFFESYGYICLIREIAFTHDFGPDSMLRQSWHCGYVAMPKGHKYEKADKKGEIDWFEEPLEVHGGLTFYSLVDLKGYGKRFCLGFDTLHAFDTDENCTIDYVEANTLLLLSQIATNSGDLAVIEELKTKYGVKKIE